jgi:uracil-DNA glycosylase
MRCAAARCRAGLSSTRAPERRRAPARPENTAALLREIRACTHCAGKLPLAPRPVLQADAAARILVVGQAPGRKAHDTGQPFNDPSGDRLRDWMGVDRSVFYDPQKIALVPMGFCFPGTGPGGDLPPRPECAALWRERLLATLPHIELTLLLGQHAVAWHLKAPRSRPLAASVQDWRSHWPALLPMPHPSPRNMRWFKLHPWFEAELVPALRERVREILKAGD